MSRTIPTVSGLSRPTRPLAAAARLFPARPCRQGRPCRPRPAYPS